jgi:phosphomethylpyrimidine synthase
MPEVTGSHGNSGKSFLMKNRAHDVTGVHLGRQHPPALGVIIGITAGETTPDLEYEKAATAVALGVNMLSDVTTNGDASLRCRILKALDVVLGTVPTYEIYRRIRRDGRHRRDAVLSVLEEHATEGVDFVTIHASSTLSAVRQLDSTGRLIPVTSRGGAMMAEIMVESGDENPYWTHFDEILDLCEAHGLTLSLAGTFRTGSIADAMSATHLDEVKRQGELVRRAHARGVKVKVELIGHAPLHLIPAYCALGDKELDGAPFGALGPLPTDIAITYDDVAGAIGAATAVMHGVSCLACLTAGEHCHIPSYDDMVRAIKYFQIAIHIGWTARTGDIRPDSELSKARSRNDWTAMAELAIHRQEAHELIERQGYHDGQSCSMCRGACPLVRTRTITGATAAWNQTY